MIASVDSLFHDAGLIYFWVLNDRLDDAALEAMLQEFVDAGVAAVCLHPRSGLELPYGGSDWFERITWITQRCAERNLAVWLYDEDPYPSGAAGGRLLMERPDLVAQRIERDAADPALKPGDHFTFAPGKLLWCGLIDECGQGVVDWTSRVGVLRRQWTVLPQWDSRYYYPQTPLYQCPRAWTSLPELALRIPQHDRAHDASLRLVAFTARPIAFEPSGSHWPAKPDSLNPRATDMFLAMTHERYRETLGSYLGSTIAAMFTDEPKWHDARPYTPGLLESLAQQGFDLRPHLEHLFNIDQRDQAMLTRLRYRQWCSERFSSAWVEPVARWCSQHRLALVGHISPEDDPIEQSNCVGNLLPLMKQFALPGIDLIIPAVGDADHPLLNLGVVCAASVRAQQGKPGVLSESLACSGHDFTTRQAQRILAWQTVMGVTTLVVHAAYQSQEGYRSIDAPPDFGPRSPRWSGMQQVARSLVNAQHVLRRGQQVAPVAILWPIRTFMALNLDWQRDEMGFRRQLAELLLRCLQHQVGVHMLDEQDLWQSQVVNGTLRVGDCRYSHLLVPPAWIWHQRSVTMLRHFHSGGGKVLGIGEPARWLQTDAGLQPLPPGAWLQDTMDRATVHLPRLLDMGNAPEVRCTAWQCQDDVTLLCTTLAPQTQTIHLDGQPINLTPGDIHIRTLAREFRPGE